MQDYETSQDSANASEDECQRSRFGTMIKSLFKRLVVFLCFGPGILGVVWIIGRLFKR